MDSSVNYTVKSENETFSLGVSLAAELSEGSIVALSGQLGAGKTCFARGIAHGLGVKEEVTSPTYTIISEYMGIKYKVFHIDAYRLSGSGDFSVIGGEEIIFGKGISIIEWYEKINEFIGADTFRVKIKIVKDDERIIQITRPEP